jgi:mono/diheme cytochrome c family protein
VQYLRRRPSSGIGVSDHRAGAMTSPMRLLRLTWLLAAFSCSCNRGPDAPRMWQPSDHQHTIEPGAQAAEMPAEADGEGEAVGAQNVLLSAWAQNCAVCHGPAGCGDGPRAAMTGAPDLTQASWQDSVTDQQIAAVIRQGRGQMPRFTFPDATVQGLVRFIRASRSGDASVPTPIRASPAAQNQSVGAAPSSPHPRPPPRPADP